MSTDCIPNTSFKEANWRLLLCKGCEKARVRGTAAQGAVSQRNASPLCSCMSPSGLWHAYGPHQGAKLNPPTLLEAKKKPKKHTHKKRIEPAQQKAGSFSAVLSGRNKAPSRGRGIEPIRPSTHCSQTSAATAAICARPALRPNRRKSTVRDNANIQFKVQEL